MLHASLRRATAPRTSPRWRVALAPCQRTARLAVRSVSTQQPSSPPGLAPLPWDGTPEQLKALEQLRARFAAGAGAPVEETLQWYLRDRYFDVDEAEQKLRATQAWRKALRAEGVTQEAVAAEMATGKSYVHEQPDIYGRPVLVIQANKHNIGEFPLEDSKRLCTYMLDTALSRLPPGGEQIIALVDLRGINMAKNIDLAFVAFMVDAFFVYYPRRIGQVLLVDAPWLFKGPWEVIKPLLRKYGALVRFASRQELAAEFFTPSSLPPVFRQ